MAAHKHVGEPDKVDVRAGLMPGLLMVGMVWPVVFVIGWLLDRSLWPGSSSFDRGDDAMMATAWALVAGIDTLWTFRRKPAADASDDSRPPTPSAQVRRVKRRSPLGRRLVR